MEDHHPRQSTISAILAMLVIVAVLASVAYYLWKERSSALEVQRDAQRNEPVVALQQLLAKDFPGSPNIPVTILDPIHVWNIATMPSQSYKNVGDMTRDSQGYYYFTLPNEGMVVKYRRDGSLAGRIGKGHCLQPSGIAVDAKGDIFIADTDDHKIKHFRADGTFVRALGKKGWVPMSDSQHGKGLLTRPGPIAVDNAGSIYVLDSGNHRVQKFDVQGNTLALWGGFNTPTDIDVDAAGNIYVANSKNGGVYQFSDTGSQKAHWQTRFINHINVDGANVVYGRINDAILVFDDTGMVNRAMICSGVKDRGGLPFIIDTDNNEIAVLSQDKDDKEDELQMRFYRLP